MKKKWSYFILGITIETTLALFAYGLWYHDAGGFLGVLVAMIGGIIIAEIES